MAQPSDLLRQHAARGRKIRSDLLVARQSKKSADSNVAAGVDALAFFFDLSGKKRLAKGVGRHLMHSSVDKSIADMESKEGEWTSESRTMLRRITILRRGIPSKPNSDSLVRSFSAQIKYARPETRLSHGIQYLEDLAESSLIFNDELEETRRAVATVEKSSPIPPADIESGLRELLELVSRFPTVAEALTGAISVYQQKGPDWGRQALSSMRNALETLVKRLSGESEWRLGLEKIVPSDTARRQFHQTYAMLCARGVHSEEIPPENDVLFCIRLTQEEIKYLIKCQAGTGKAG